MKTPFVSALLTAICLSRGLNDGSNKENAFESVLLTDALVGTLTLYTYNVWNEIIELSEVHGDLEITNYGIESPSNPSQAVTEWV